MVHFHDIYMYYHDDDDDDDDENVCNDGLRCEYFDNFGLLINLGINA